tara:strand:+ start:659 stop:832 length:174 start_codon:yes stop_codon:yes gene_type:complete
MGVRSTHYMTCSGADSMNTIMPHTILSKRAIIIEKRRRNSILTKLTIFLRNWFLQFD